MLSSITHYTSVRQTEIWYSIADNIGPTAGTHIHIDGGAPYHRPLQEEVENNRSAGIQAQILHRGKVYSASKHEREKVRHGDVWKQRRPNRERALQIKDPDRKLKARVDTAGPT